MNIIFQFLPRNEQLPGTVTIQQRHSCAKAACDVCWFAHERAADSYASLRDCEADAVLLGRYR